MLQKEQLEKLLERCMASSCDFAEIFEEEGTTESLSMLNGKLEDTNVLIRAGIGIRLYKGVQSVYGYTNETSEESLNTLVDDLRGGFGTESKSVSISLVEETHENLHPIKENPVKASLESKVALMVRANDAAKAYSDQIQKVSVGLQVYAKMYRFQIVKEDLYMIQEFVVVCLYPLLPRMVKTYNLVMKHQVQVKA